MHFSNSTQPLYDSINFGAWVRDSWVYKTQDPAR